MTVDPQQAAGSFDYEGRTYYFCAPGCRERFRVEPQRYLNRQPVTIGIERAPAKSFGITQITRTENGGPGWPRSDYTCPMHPEIVRDAPASCPICGMALEPRTVTLAEEKNPELIDMTRRFWVSAVLSVPLLLIAMGEMLPGDPVIRVLPMRSVVWIQMALATPVIVWGGWPFFVRAWQSIGNRSPNMFTLIGLGMSVAYVYSLTATLAPQIFPASFRDPNGNVPVYFESAAVITTLV